MPRFKLMVKPLSVNRAWMGRRFKTKEYKEYSEILKSLLPDMELPPPPYILKLEFGFSTDLADGDNPVKLIQDILAKHYGFNDRKIRRWVIDKQVVGKGNEYIIFELRTFTPPGELPLT